MKTTRKILAFWLTRLGVLLLSLTLLFSGFVKAADPQGMAIKLNAYLHHWGISWPDNALGLQVGVVALAAAEFLLGLYLLLGIRRRFTTAATAVFMVLMTAVSVWLLLRNPVPDCGCFGAALDLTNWQTFLKNAVLLAIALFLARKPRRIQRLISERNQWITSVWAFVYIVGLTIFTFQHLPRIDFTAYKVGADLRRAAGGDLLTKADEQLASFFVYSPEGDDLTDGLLADTGYTFLLTISDVLTADDSNSDRINDLADYCRDNGLRLLGVSAETLGEGGVADWTDRTGAAYPMAYADESQLKAMVRSNPGLLLLHDGKVAGKWSGNDLPEADTLTSVARLEQSTAQRGWLALLLWFFVPLLAVIVADRVWVGSKFYKHYIYKKHLTKKRMRKKIVAGNWKMNLNLQQGVELAKELNAALLAEKSNCDVVICTPFIHLASVAQIVDPAVVGVGAENCADKEKGAYTGEVSAEMVKSTGAQYVILGHSERRQYYAETPEILKEKVLLALKNGLKVIFCIGETLEEREAEKQNEVVKAELEGSVFNLTAEEWKNIILAYEPIWAIGTGKTATAEQAEEMLAYIRKTVAEKYGAEAAEETSILYGGSCKASNAGELFSKPDIDGGLIGGASLKVADFKGIIDAWKK